MIRSDWDGLLATIIANPRDDTPRLVSADWLEEHGGQPERAEFVRLQCRLALMPAFCPADPERMKGECPCTWHRLKRRERELLSANKETLFPLWEMLWNGLEQNWRSLEEPAEFRRGFVEKVACSFADWETHHAAIMQSTPLAECELTTRPDDFQIGPPLIGTNCARNCSMRIGGRVVRKTIDFLANPMVAVDRIIIELLTEAFPGITFTLPPERPYPEPPALVMSRLR